MKTYQNWRKTVAAIVMLSYTANITAQQQVDTENLVDMDLEDLMNLTVSSSSFFNLKSSETPGYIFNLDQQKIYSQQSLIENVRMLIPGMSDGAHPDTEIVGVRGMKTVDNSKTMIMFDGQSLNLRANVGYGIGLSSKLLGDVKNLEVSLGPNAIVHGSGAISGYLNMVPKNGYDNNGIFINVAKEFEKNADNQKNAISKTELGYGFGNEKRNAYIYAGYYFSNGWTPDSCFTTKQLTKDILNESKVGNTERANFRLSAHTNFDGLTFNIGYLQNYRSSWSSKATAQNDFTRQMNAKLKYALNIGSFETIEFAISNELTDLGRIQSTQVGGAESHSEGKIIAKTTRFNNNQLAIGALWGVRKFYAGKFYFGHDIDPTIADNAYVRDPLTGNSYADEKGKSDANYLWASGQMPNGKWNEFAVFAEDIYKLNDAFVVALGIRFDKFKVKEFDDTQHNIAPRIAFSYIINDQHVVKAAYQQGFRTMDFYNMGQTLYQKVPQVIYALSKADILSNYSFNIEPEKLHSIELNYIGEFANKILKIEANAYFNIYQNTIDYYPLVSWTSNTYLENNNYIGDYTAIGEKYFTPEQQKYFMTNFVSSSYKKNKNKSTTFGAYVNNSDDIKIVGGEFIANLNTQTDTHVRLSYSLANPITDSYGKTAQYPEHQIKASAMQYLFSKTLMLSAQFEFEPSLKDNEENRVAYHDVYFEPRTLFDATAAYTIKQYVTIAATVNNILGENRPGITYKPDMSNNYVELTNIGSNERRYWLSIKVNI